MLESTLIFDRQPLVDDMLTIIIIIPPRSQLPFFQNLQITMVSVARLLEAEACTLRTPRQPSQHLKG